MCFVANRLFYIDTFRCCLAQESWLLRTELFFSIPYAPIKSNNPCLSIKKKIEKRGKSGRGDDFDAFGRSINSNVSSLSRKSMSQLIGIRAIYHTPAQFFCAYPWKLNYRLHRAFYISKCKTIIASRMEGRGEVENCDEFPSVRFSTVKGFSTGGCRLGILIIITQEISCVPFAKSLLGEFLLSFSYRHRHIQLAEPYSDICL